MPNLPSASPVRIQAQQRMHAAMSAVEKVSAASLAKKYKALVRGAPADIQTNGLAQATAFWRAKGRDEHKRLLEHLEAWLAAKEILPKDTKLHAWIADPKTTNTHYVLATHEAMAYIGWLKRAAEAQIS